MPNARAETPILRTTLLNFDLAAKTRSLMDTNPPATSRLGIALGRNKNLAMSDGLAKSPMLELQVINPTDAPTRASAKIPPGRFQSPHRTREEFKGFGKNLPTYVRMPLKRPP